MYRDGYPVLCVQSLGDLIFDGYGEIQGKCRPDISISRGDQGKVQIVEDIRYACNR